MARICGPVIVAAMIVAAATAGFAIFAAPRESVVAFGGLFFGSAAILGAAVWRKRKSLWTLPWRRTLVLIVLVAALLRMAALVAPVSLSDDIWRYLWDGQMVAAGENPYAETPSERIDRGGGDPALFGDLNQADTHTVYPPLSQGVFALAVMLEETFGGAAERWLRGLFSVFDLLGITILGWVLARQKRSVMWVALYAWHPLVYWEVAGGGHTEALGIVWLAALVGLALSGRAIATGVAIGLAGLAKWTFLVVSPVVAFYLLRTKGWPAAIAATVSALVVFAVGYIPFYFEQLWEYHEQSIRLYTESFSFNSPVYYSLRWLLGYREGITEPVHHITGPILTATTVVAVACVSWWQNGSSRRFLAGITLAAGAYVVFSPVFHPWYALPLLATGALAGWTTPAVLGLVVVASYAFYAPWMSGAIMIVLMGLQLAIVGIWLIWRAGPGMLESVLQRRAANKVENIENTLRGGEKILDLGAAEGYVGAELARMGNEVQLVDVVDRNRTDLPMQTYDGESLEFDEDSFDIVVLSYVLHHAAEPDRVLGEALRVGERVVLLETVYERPWDRGLVTVLDQLANGLRGMAPEPLQFDTVDGWLTRIDDLGGEVIAWKWLGRGIHRHVVIECCKK